MKKFALLALVGLSMTSCWVARIYTEVPTTEVVVPVKTVYTTEVVTPSPKVTTLTTFTVTDYNTRSSSINDNISLSSISFNYYA